MSTTPAEHPVLFNGDMVRAIQAGMKTQTRRPMVPQPDMSRLKRGVKLEAHRCPQLGPVHHGRSEWGLYGTPYKATDVPVCGYRCPFGGPGDTLWVRETWAHTNDYDGQYLMDGRKALYRADKEQAIIPSRWRPSIHMPRWASRINLPVTRVWVERLQDISVEDAIAEGMEVGDMPGHLRWVPQRMFSRLWDSIYAKQGLGWDINPWVWAAEFQQTPEVKR